MSDEKDIILAYIDRQWSQAKQCEDQRSLAANIILPVFGAIQWYIVQRNFDSPCLALAVLLMAASSYGLILTEKYYERFRLHAARVGEAMNALVRMYPDADLNMLEEAAKVKHLKSHALMYSINLHILWRLFFGLLIALAFLNLIIILDHAKF